MFKDRFTEANNSIHADEELVNKVLSLKDPENRRSIKRKKISSHIPAAAAAAVLVCAVTAAVPFITRDQDTGGVISESTQITDSTEHKKSAEPVQKEAKAKAPVSEAKATEAPVSEAKASKAPASGATASQKSISSETSAPKQSNTNPQAKAEYSEPKPETEPETQTAEETVPSAKRSYELDSSKAAGSPRISSAPERVVLSMNSVAHLPENAAISVRKASLPEDISYTQWSFEDYFNYLGKPVCPVLPNDFTFTGHNGLSVTDSEFLSEQFELSVDEQGIPVFDTKIFTFEGENGRCAAIQTSKDTSIADAYLTDSAFTLSRIGDFYGVLIGTVDDCRGYIKADNAAYVVNAYGLTEEELKAFLLSVTE